MTNRFTKDKLLNSKWTALDVKAKEKHFMVTDLIRDEQTHKVTQLILQAVMTKNDYLMPPDELKNAAQWQMGWH